jgi:hypothetical protein
MDIHTVVMEPGVTTIGNHAFEDCKNMTSVTIPNGVTKIGWYAFGWCYDLASVTIPGSVITIGHEAFYLCKTLTSVIIPDGVTTIERFAFNGCLNLISITIPASVTSIEDCPVFSGCEKLTSIEVDSENNVYSSEDGVLFNKDKTLLINYPEGKTDGEYIIPNGVQIIEGCSFQYCKGLTSVTIPYGVTNIGYNCGETFWGCTNLTLITNLNPVPVEIDGTIFVGVDQSACTLQVPMCAVSAYENAPIWQDFNIVGIDDTYEIFVLANPPEGGEVTGSGIYSCGDEVTVEAISNEAWAFVNWTNAIGVVVSCDPVFMFMPMQSDTLVANFAPTYDVILYSNPPEAGEVIGGGTFAYGDVVTVSGVPTPDYEFINWLEDGIEISTGSEYTFTVTGARTLTGNFETYDIVIQSNSPYGIVFGGGNYRPGIEITVSATVAKTGNYEFVNWTKEGVEVSTDAEYTFITPIGDMELVANFRETTLGIEEINSGVEVYPNPTTGELIIDCSNGACPIVEKVEIFDLMGKCVAAAVETGRAPSLQHPTPTSTTTLNISSFPAGMYFVKITTETGAVTRKIIKQ